MSVDATITSEAFPEAIVLRPADMAAATIRARLRALDPPLRLIRGDGVLRVRWDDAGRLDEADLRLAWSDEMRIAVRNREDVRERHAMVLQQAAAIADEGAALARIALADVRPLIELDDHQALNVALMTLPGGWGTCIFDEQGTGKTPTVIAAFDVLVERDEADVLLIVAPKSMVGEWAAEFHRFAGDLYRVAVVTGTRRQRAQALSQGADVVVVGFEGAVQLQTDLRNVARRSRTVLAVDESYNVKNPDAARTAAVCLLREYCSRCFVLCGTPAPNTSVDIVSQVSLVDFGLAFDGTDLSGDDFTVRDRVASTLAGRTILSRNLKSEVLPELPTRAFRQVRVPLAPEQRRLYDALAQDLLADLREVDDAAFGQRRMAFMERRIRLLQACSQPRAIDPRYSEVPAKFAVLDRLLAESADRDEKVVVWSYFRATLDELAARYAALGLVRIDGSVTDVSIRRDAVLRFQEDEATRVFLGNPAAAGAGITLHRAATAVYESTSNQAAHFMQSLDRIHRRGQTKAVEYIFLVGEDTIEVGEYERLQAKIGAQAAMLGDPAPPVMTRTAMINEISTRVGSSG